VPAGNDESSPDDRKVLDMLAREASIEPSAVWLERGVVWARNPEGELRTLCQLDTPWWHAAVVRTFATHR